MDRLTKRQIDGQQDKEMNGQIDKQADGMGTESQKHKKMDNKTKR